MQNYETKVFACEQELEKILWNTKSDEESYRNLGIMMTSESEFASDYLFYEG